MVHVLQTTQNSVISRCFAEVVRSSGTSRFSFPGWQGIMEVVYQLNHKKTKLRLAQVKHYLRDTCLKGKLAFELFSKP